MTVIRISRDMDGATALQMLYLIGSEGICYEIDWYEYDKVHVDAHGDIVRELLNDYIDDECYSIEEEE